MEEQRIRSKSHTLRFGIGRRAGKPVIVYDSTRSGTGGKRWRVAVAERRVAELGLGSMRRHYVCQMTACYTNKKRRKDVSPTGRQENEESRREGVAHRRKKERRHRVRQTPAK